MSSGIDRKAFVAERAMGDYQICVSGHLDASWSDWFDQMRIQHEPNGTTTLIGPVADQAALYGLIRKLADMGLALLAVCPLATPCAGELCLLRWRHSS